MQPMRRTRRSKGWLWLFLIVLLVAGFWWFGGWQKAKNFVFTFQDSDTAPLSGAVPSPGTIQEKAGRIFEKIMELPGAIVSETWQTITQSAVDTTKKGASDVLRTVEEQFGLPPPATPADTVNEKPLEVSLLGKRGQPLLFVVEGREADGSYTIAWGDSEQTSGAIRAREKKNIPHTWSAAGSYLVVAEITDATKISRRFSIPVFIE